MSTTSTIRAYFVPCGGSWPKIQDIATITKPPYTPCFPSPGLSDQEAQDFADRELNKNHALVHESAGHVPKFVRLPNVQPDRPEAWEADAWDTRLVVGSAEYHLFHSGKDYSNIRNPPFVLKVSAVRDGSRLVYEDIGPLNRQLQGDITEFIPTVSKAV